MESPGDLRVEPGGGGGGLKREGTPVGYNAIEPTFQSIPFLREGGGGDGYL